MDPVQNFILELKCKMDWNKHGNTFAYESLVLQHNLRKNAILFAAFKCDLFFFFILSPKQTVAFQEIGIFIRSAYSVDYNKFSTYFQ